MDHNHRQNGTGTSLDALFEVKERLLPVEDWLAECGLTASADELRRHCGQLDRLGEVVGRYEAKWGAIPLSKGLGERINAAGDLAQEFLERLMDAQPEESVA